MPHWSFPKEISFPSSRDSEQSHFIEIDVIDFIMVDSCKKMSNRFYDFDRRRNPLECSEVLSKFQIFWQAAAATK